MIIHKIGISALFAVNMAISATAIATDFSFAGTFAADDEVQLFNFSVDSESTIILRTYNYAGGVQADGNVVSRGGFDPILALFDSVGNFIAYNDDGAAGSVDIDPETREAFDTALEIVLDAGDYTVSVMQYNNKATGPTLDDGFDQTGDPFFTSIYNCSNGQFCDASNADPYNNRTNEWAFDVLNVVSAIMVVPDSATDPEPEHDCQHQCDRSKKHHRSGDSKGKHMTRCSLKARHHNHPDCYKRSGNHDRHHCYDHDEDRVTGGRRRFSSESHKNMWQRDW